MLHGELARQASWLLDGSVDRRAGGWKGGLVGELPVE